MKPAHQKSLPMIGQNHSVIQSATGRKLCYALAISASLLLAACTSTSNPVLAKDDCASPDWQALGAADGKAGRYPHEISRHQRHCPSIVLTESVRAAWEAGRQQGLASYCTKANAYELGQRGYALNQVCPEEGLLEIQQSHALGYQIYYQRQRLHNDVFNPWYAPFGYPWRW